MYKRDSFALFTAHAWRKNVVEVIEYGGEIWMNQGHLQEKLDLSNISDRTQYYSDEFEKNEMRNTRVWNLSTLQSVYSKYFSSKIKNDC